MRGKEDIFKRKKEKGNEHIGLKAAEIFYVLNWYFY